MNIPCTISLRDNNDYFLTRSCLTGGNPSAITEYLTCSWNTEELVLELLSTGNIIELSTDINTTVWTHDNTDPVKSGSFNEYNEMFMKSGYRFHYLFCDGFWTVRTLTISPFTYL